MRLEVVGNTDLSVEGTQNIHINYNPGTKCVSVVCMADVVTAKIAIEILEEKYQEAIKPLSEFQIGEIERVVKEAINYGSNRDQSFKSRCDR